VKITHNLLNKNSRQRCGDFVPTVTHTNTPDWKFNWQVLLIHCFTAHLEALVGNSTWLSSIITSNVACLWDPNNSLVKINCYLLNNKGLIGSDVMILFYSVVCQGWLKTSFLQLVGNMTYKSRCFSLLRVYTVGIKEIKS